MPIVLRCATYASTPPRWPSSSSPRCRSEHPTIPAPGAKVASSSAAGAWTVTRSADVGVVGALRVLEDDDGEVEHGRALRVGDAPMIGATRRRGLIRFGGYGPPAACDDRDVATDEQLIGESRWLPALIVLGFMVINVAVRIWFPRDGVLAVPWLVPLLEFALVVLLLTSDPAGAAERRRLRRITIGLVGLLVLASLWATGLLIHDLITGTGNANDANELLASGALVWVGNNLVFAIVYWLLDGGGPIARKHLTVPVDIPR